MLITSLEQIYINEFYNELKSRELAICRMDIFYFNDVYEIVKHHIGRYIEIDKNLKQDDIDMVFLTHIITDTVVEMFVKYFNTNEDLIEITTHEIGNALIYNFLSTSIDMENSKLDRLINFINSITISKIRERIKDIDRLKGIFFKNIAKDGDMVTICYRNKILKVVHVCKNDT